MLLLFCLLDVRILVGVGDDGVVVDGGVGGVVADAVASVASCVFSCLRA